MREVRACDFCGESAAGVFEVLPAGVAGDEPKRMLLCDGCETTLADVVDPLLDTRADEPPLVAEAEPTSERDDDAETAAESHADEDRAASEDAGETESSEADEREREAAETDTSEDDAVHEAGGRPANSRRGTPKGYSKVMRFLEGRDFPMERETAESMASEAYEMDASTVSAAIDHAAKHGRVRVASGKLFR